jgi:hypothetical protein
MRRLAAILAVALSPAGVAAAQTPIPEGMEASRITPYIGRPATPQPVGSILAPRHPFMAPNGSSNLHEDAWQTDTSVRTGPLGRDMSRRSTFYAHECASITFDSRGRIVTVCVGLERPILKLLDPNTLAEIASMDLPARRPGGDPSTTFTNFSGGGYFYLDHRDRAVIPTNELHIVTVAVQGDEFVEQGDVDVSATMESDDGIISALPDWSGAVWYATKNGVVGRIDPATQQPRAMALNEPIGNSFAIGEDGGVYIVSDAALYRFDTGADGAPAVTWRETYANTGQLKPGQTQRGSGTTPTLIGNDLVAITDNADPMNIVVYRRTPAVTGPRLLCTAPVFEKGASNTDQSLIATDRSIVTENNYGYSGPAATQNGRSTVGGLERVDIDRATGTCRSVWRSSERAPSVVPKLSLGNGLVYTYTKDPQPGDEDAWYLTAIDFRTGETVYKRLAGEGLGFNNNYAPITIGPDGTIYVGVLGGMVALRDATPPRQEAIPPPGDAAAAPRAPRITVRTQRGKRRCIARVRGADRRLARRLSAMAGIRRLVRRDRSAPFRVVLRRRNRALRMVVTLRDGRRVTVRTRC